MTASPWIRLYDTTETETHDYNSALDVTLQRSLGITELHVK